MAGTVRVPDGTLNAELMPDGLHPGAAAYERWAPVLRDAIRKLV